MGDAADILGITPENAGVKSPNAGALDLIARSRSSRSLGSPKSLIPAGMSREVYSLTDGQAAPLVPTATGFKEKASLKGIVEWEWAEFRNSARSDGVKLAHWAKKGDVRPDYVFARFNKKIELTRYSDAEYTRFCQDPRWSREMTDHLFELCERFDLRFPIVTDRFEYPGFTMEDLKDRYYSITRALMVANSTDTKIQDHPLIKHPYDVEYEKKRIEQFNRLYFRTHAQEYEEAYIVAEMRKINKAKRKNERALSRASQMVKETKKTPRKKRKRNSSQSSNKIQIQFSPGGTASVVPAAKRANKAPRKPKSAGFMRSAKLMVPLQCGQKVAKKVDLFLDDLKIPRRPMATAAVADAYNGLRQDVLRMFDLQKALQKKQYEVTSLRETRDRLLRSVGGEAGAQRAAAAANVRARAEEEEALRKAAQAAQVAPAQAASFPLQPGAVPTTAALSSQVQQQQQLLMKQQQEAATAQHIAIQRQQSGYATPAYTPGQ